MSDSLPSPRTEAIKHFSNIARQAAMRHVETTVVVPNGITEDIDKVVWAQKSRRVQNCDIALMVISMVEAVLLEADAIGAFEK